MMGTSWKRARITILSNLSIYSTFISSHARTQFHWPKRSPPNAIMHVLIAYWERERQSFQANLFNFRQLYGTHCQTDKSNAHKYMCTLYTKCIITSRKYTGLMNCISRKSFPNPFLRRNYCCVCHVVCVCVRVCVSILPISFISNHIHTHTNAFTLLSLCFHSVILLNVLRGRERKIVKLCIRILLCTRGQIDFPCWWKRRLPFWNSMLWLV